MTKVYVASLHTDGMTWSAANAEAQSLGGYLVTINDSTEDSLVDNFIWRDASRFGTKDAPTGEYFLPWIGAYLPPASPNYAWANGEPFAYSNWDGTPSGNAAELVLKNSTTGETHWLATDGDNPGHIVKGYIAEFDAETVQGSSGTDNILIASGAANVNAGAGDDFVTGGAGNDTIDGGPGHDFVQGGDGNDSLEGGDGLNDLLEGGTGDDTIHGTGLNMGSPMTFLVGEDGNDSLIGSSGNELLSGGDGNDTLVSGGGRDDLAGGPGDDVFRIPAGFGFVTIAENANSGTDTINLTNIDPSRIRLWTSADGDLHLQDVTNPNPLDRIDIASPPAGATFPENIAGTRVEQIVFDDGTIWDLTGGLMLTGTASAEALYGTAHDDTIDGVTGNDTLFGFDGNDSLAGSGTNSLAGGAGDDTYLVRSTATSIKEVNGEGLDAVLADVSAYTLPKFVENMMYVGSGAFNGVGNAQANALTGGGMDDTLSGLAGNDSLSGGEGADSLDGGNGNDTLGGGEGADALSGGSNNDSLSGGNENDTLLGGLGNDLLDGGDGSDSVSGDAGGDTISGGDGNDALSGGDGNDSLSGGDGGDTIDGGIGANKLSGDAGDDSITGGDLADIISGGAGSDTMAGGTGADRFLFAAGDFAAAASDEITDFNHAEKDKINLSAIDAIDGTPGSKFHFIGAAAFSHVAGQLHYVVNAGGGVTVEGDTNGDGVGDFSILVDHVAALAAGDFVL